MASGPGSVVLSEAQIFRQMKNAVCTAIEVGTLGAYLNQLFRCTFAVAEEVRGMIKIDTHSVSMAAAAVCLA